MNCAIAHKGIVRTISDDMITVAIAAESACGDCHAKTICGFSEVSEKLVHVQNNSARNVQVGDEVRVAMDSTLGTKAVLLAYIIPLFILIATLFILLQFTTDILATTIALALVAYHFLILHKNKNKLERKFSFSIIQ